MAYTLTSQATGYFSYSDGAVTLDLQRGDIQAVYNGDNVTIYDKLAPAFTPLINNVPVTSILNGDNSNTPFASLAAFKTWWRANTPQLVSVSGGGGGGGTSSTYPKYTTGLIRKQVINNATFTALPNVACNVVIIHHFSGSITELYRLGDAANVLLLQDETRYMFSGLANAQELLLRSGVAGYEILIECITV